MTGKLGEDFWKDDEKIATDENYKEFSFKYEKSVREGYDDYSLINTLSIKTDKNDYKDFTNYIENLSDYLQEMFKYTYGSKAKKSKGTCSDHENREKKDCCQEAVHKKFIREE
jgi:hypothetical protein